MREDRDHAHAVGFGVCGPGLVWSVVTSLGWGIQRGD